LVHTFILFSSSLLFILTIVYFKFLKSKN
jgi:hypothetical protein